MRTMDDAMEAMLFDNIIFPEEAYPKAVNKQKFALLAGISRMQAAANEEVIIKDTEVAGR